MMGLPSELWTQAMHVPPHVWQELERVACLQESLGFDEQLVGALSLNERLDGALGPSVLDLASQAEACLGGLGEIASLGAFQQLPGIDPSVRAFAEWLDTEAQSWNAILAAADAWRGHGWSDEIGVSQLQQLAADATLSSESVAWLNEPERPVSVPSLPMTAASTWLTPAVALDDRQAEFEERGQEIRSARRSCCRSSAKSRAA